MDETKNFKEDSVWVKMNKSEIEWNIIALAIAEKSSEMHEKIGNAKSYKKLKDDFVKIKEQILQKKEER